ncbi:MAG: DegT/DnrJ/EryC1/StrS family aminotransferase, partial [Rhodospirillales bacterium]|nr:DegT/DnrJ/EryC1/StrS family aminotransferase [Rhodospirillales bacterium]
VPDSTSAWAIYSVLLRDSAARGRMQSVLREAGIPAAIYYPRPLHQQPAYRDHHDGARLPVSEALAERILALPIHPDLSEEAVVRICDTVISALR